MSTHEILFIVFSYLVGSIPFGLLLYFLMEKKDIRQEGSGNIGATNVMRTEGKCAGIATLALDMTKGIIPVLYGVNHFDSRVVIISGGAAAVLGHLFSIYLKLRGGKGISSFVGAILIFNFPSALIFGGVFISVLYFTRYVSLSSIASVIAVLIFSLFIQPFKISIIILIIAIIIIIKHHKNIHRLLKGVEYKFERITCDNEKE